MSGPKIGKRARAFYAPDKTATHGAGVIIAYCDAPTYVIERPDGTRFSWRADLTEAEGGE